MNATLSVYTHVDSLVPSWGTSMGVGSNDAASSGSDVHVSTLLNLSTCLGVNLSASMT